ncbi:hypothetical protein [Kitasatospora sp. LaBMicrA B282]|uniref:hypothetical protein n=1 Tax=Kitasatospora sp. LaBMicrA B282 TaxID=3420949 RepID=UPI003D097A4E
MAERAYAAARLAGLPGALGSLVDLHGEPALPLGLQLADCAGCCTALGRAQVGAEIEQSPQPILVVAGELVDGPRRGRRSAQRGQAGSVPAPTGGAGLPHRLVAGGDEVSARQAVQVAGGGVVGHEAGLPPPAATHRAPAARR